MIILQILAGLAMLLLLFMGLALVFNKMDSISKYLEEHPRVFPTTIGTLLILMFIGAVVGELSKY